MIRLNLLPYRERRQGQQRQNCQRWLATLLAVGCAVALGAALKLEMQHRRQHNRIEMLQHAHSELDRQIIRTQELAQQNQQLSAHLSQLEQLQQRRNDTVKLLTALALHTPAGLVVRSVRQDAAQLTLHGHANSHQNILTMLARLQESDAIGAIQIRQTRQNGQRLNFIMTAAILDSEAIQ